jgi:hypothetical protein
MKQFIPLGSEAPGDPMVTVEESDGGIVLDYSFPGFFLVDNHREIKGEEMPFKQVVVPSAGSLCESGKPQLPSLGRYLQIPPDCDYDVSLTVGEAVPYGSVLVWPAQMNLTAARRKKHTFEFDKKFYLKDSFYPKEVFQILGPYNIAETRALLVHVTPLQYNPANRQLLGYKKITVTVAVRPRPGLDSDGLAGAPVKPAAFGNLFLNTGSGIEGGLTDPTYGPADNRPESEFLIIFAEEFREAAEELAYWKNSRGIITEVVSTNITGNTVADLKAYIRSRRANALSSLRYVLLFGDTDTITTETIPRSPNEPKSPYGKNTTDYYYSTVDDSDPPSADSLLPPLAIGRIPVQNAVEAVGVVDQIINYEKNPPEDPDYYRRMVFAAAFEDMIPQDNIDDRENIETLEYIRSCLQPFGYVGERVYVSNNNGPQLYYKSGNPVPPNVMAAIVKNQKATQKLVDATTEGRLIICHRGHGVWNRWAGPSFTNANLGSVTSNVPSIFYSINCETGQFDCGDECFAEKNLRMKGGAPSLIAATRESNNILNNHLIQGLFDATFPGVLPSFPVTAGPPVQIRRLGDILNYAKSYLPLAALTNKAYIKDHFEIYHVIGDPTLELWTKFPGTLALNATLTRDSLNIRLSSSPIGCVLTIWCGEQMIERIEPSASFIVIPAERLPTECTSQQASLRICCWAPDYRYCEIEVNLE